jgi:orotidine-5'-phosphate decarboxylase
MTATPIVALDVPDVESALRIVKQLADSCDFYKIGGELFTASGPRAVLELREVGKRVFLDLKFHDIPRTVRAAAGVAARLGASLITVHATGGEEMLRAAVEGAGDGSGASSGSECGVLAVTVLTSLDAATLEVSWGRPSVDLSAEVVRLSRSAMEAGAHGVVCAGGEVAAVRLATNGRLATLVPGVRFEDAPHNDQQRVITPYEAAAQGAQYLVLGRAVTGATDPVAAMHRVRDEIRRGALETTVHGASQGAGLAL